MKKNTIIRNTGIACLLAVVFSACSDFLNILPMNDIVLENFWSEQEDVDNAVNGCYSALTTSDCITRMFIWGELRSDNISLGSSTPETETQMLKSNILPTNSYTSWTCIYQVINRCNTVLHYAPQVQAIDPNYTPSELKATIAEVTSLRALCYFYLIRTFRDVPYVTEPSIDDNQVYVVKTSTFDEILTNLIKDLESVKDDAVRKYANKLSNTGRFTRQSIYALLADLTLWKQDYDKCINYCDLVIDSKIAEYNTEKSNGTVKFKLYGKYPLISEVLSGTSLGNAYNDIFGTGNSFESLLELDYAENQSVSNGFVSSYFGSSTKPVGYIAPTESLIKNVDGTNLFKSTDARYYEDITSSDGSYAINKYTKLSVSLNSSKSPMEINSMMSRTTSYANWILYRLTDVMLMKAEAQVEKAGSFTTSTISDDQKVLAQSAFSLVSSVYNRANNKTTASTDTLKFKDYATKTDMEKLILAERQRELMFEGKRWFDLVRMARREGNGIMLTDLTIRKYSDNQSVIRKKLSNQNAWYFPYNKDELKSNPLLKQNPAYNTESSIND